MERLQEEVTTLKDELKTKNNISEEIIQTIGSWDNSTKVKQRLTRLLKIEEKLRNSETEITKVKNQLEYGGKNFQIFPNNSK